MRGIIITILLLPVLVRYPELVHFRNIATVYQDMIERLVGDHSKLKMDGESIASRY